MDCFIWGHCRNLPTKAILGITSLYSYTTLLDPIHNYISRNLGLGIYHSKKYIYVEDVGSVCV
jgi:hypothetical protein